MADSPVRSEDVLGQKWDRCLSDTAIKTVTGLGLGIVLSFVFFKKNSFPRLLLPSPESQLTSMAAVAAETVPGRPWPMVLGSGFGLGMGYANCQHDFQNPYLVHGKRVPADQGADKSS